MLLERLLVLVMLAAAAACGADEFDFKGNYAKTETRIAMRDGIKLFTAIYTPKSAGTFPILLTRTPYSVKPYGAEAYPKYLGPLGFDEEKFIFVEQDVRGRYMSEGEFADMRPVKSVLNGDGDKDTDETTDCFDTIAWLLKNVPNNNGKVGMIGTSYPGFYTSAGLIRSHPALVAASPQAPMADLYMGDDAYHNGAFFLLANFEFYTNFNKQNNPQPPSPEVNFDYGTKDGFKFYLQMGPLANSDQLYLLNRNPYWTATYTHTTYDDFWKPRNILPRLKTVSPAVLVAGGWFDEQDLSGTLKTFRAIQTQSPGTALKLVMGPWAHGKWNREDGDKLGDMAFGSNTAETFRKAELSFFKHYLKGDPEPDLPKAWMFETGKNEWKKLEQWPPATTPQRLYFQAEGKLAARPPADVNAFDEYISDPADPVPFFAKPTLTMEAEYMDSDQRFLFGRKDVITYMSAPLTEDLTMAGPISPNLFVATSGTDSDFDVKVLDAYPVTVSGPQSGYQRLVRGEPFRGKFRNGFEKPEAFKPGAVTQIRFSMPDVYHCFLKGHRIVVQVQSSWFPLTDRNPQTFTDIPQAKIEQFVKAKERVYRSRQAASFIEFNVQR